MILNKIKTIFLAASIAISLTNYAGTALANDSETNLVNTQETVQPAKQTQSTKSESKQELTKLATNSTIINSEKKNSLKTVANKTIQKNTIKISYKIIENKSQSPAAIVYISNSEVIRYTSSAGGFSPEVRAKILVNRLEKFISNNGDPKLILPGIENGTAVGRINNEVLFTADTARAKELGLTANELAVQSANAIRMALGAPKIVRDFSHIASRSSISTAYARGYVGRQELGTASWYGGRFHGRRAADGSVFNKFEFTAAHKSLPFGSLVKVTNVNNSKSCVVKITDRGPFVPGRIIDLSTAAAKHLEMMGAGISKVKIEVIGMLNN